jgi:tetratricopeptide (TPR) repeat protein
LGKSYELIAATAFERLQKTDAQSPYVAALLADTRVQRRQYRSAYFFYEQALKQLPNLHGVHSSLAAVYKKTGHPDWAAEEDAKERALPAADCKVHAAECLFVAGHDVPAISLPRTAKTPADALYFQAKAANELALQAFFRLTQLPPSVESHRMQAEIEGSQNRHLEAVKEWKAALELSPGSLEILSEIDKSEYLGADYKSALELALKLLEKDSRSAEINYIAGASELHLEDAEKAVPYLEAALRADPKMEAAEASLGLALSRLGKNAEAIPHLEKGTELDEDGSLHYQLARAYQAAGDSAKAQATMQQYQQILKSNEEQKAEVAREAQITAPEK